MASFLKKVGNVLSTAAKDVGKVASDLGKGLAYNVALPVNSVTGHKYAPVLETKVGGALAGGAIIGANSLNVVAKTFADTLTGGKATELANKIRKDENKETMGNYVESKSKSVADLGIKGLSSLEKVSITGASVIGAVYGQKAADKAEEKIQSKVATVTSVSSPGAVPISISSGSGVPPIVPSVATKTNNDMSLSGIFTTAANIYNGLNLGQPKPTTSGGMAVPSTQSGTGIFSGLVNAASGLLSNSIGKSGGNVQPTNITAIGGAKPLTASLPGGIVISIPEKTSSYPSSGSSSTTTSEKTSPLMVIILIAVVAFVLKQLKVF